MRSNLFRLSFVVVFLLIIMVFFWRPTAPDTLDTLKQHGSLRIGYAVEYPYAFINEHQQVAGESAEIARRIAQQLGATQIEWIQLPFSQLIAALNANQVDVIAAGLFITRDRQHDVRFSVPTLKIQSGLLIPNANPKQIRQTDLTPLRADLTLAVLDGSVEQKNLLAKAQPTQLLVVENALQALDALDQQQADGILLSVPSLRPMVSSFPDDYALLPLDNAQNALFPVDYSAFAFRRSDERLVTEWNKLLQRWLGTEEHLALIRQYGFMPHDIPRETSR